MIRGPRSRRRLVLRGRFALVGMLAAGTVFGLTAANVVPESKAHDDTRQATANDLKPAACAALALVNKVAGSGTVDGTIQADLIVGGPGADTIDGRQGDDCILGGGGDDTLRGGPGYDVCIGGPGNDTFHNTCEVQIQ